MLCGGRDGISKAQALRSPSVMELEAPVETGMGGGKVRLLNR